MWEASVAGWLLHLEKLSPDFAHTLYASNLLYVIDVQPYEFLDLQGAAVGDSIPCLSTDVSDTAVCT